MFLIDFTRSAEGSQDELDVELREFDAGSEQEIVDDDTPGGRSWGQLLLVTLLLVGVAYAVSRLRSLSGDSFTDIALADDPAESDSAVDEETGVGDDTTDGKDATVTVEHDPEVEMGDVATGDEVAETNETGGTSDEETGTDDDDAVKVEIESSGDDEE